MQGLEEALDVPATANMDHCVALVALLDHDQPRRVAAFMAGNDLFMIRTPRQNQPLVRWPRWQADRDALPAELTRSRFRRELYPADYAGRLFCFTCCTTANAPPDVKAGTGIFLRKAAVGRRHEWLRGVADELTQDAVT
jgi:hypothetical protein